MLRTYTVPGKRPGEERYRVPMAAVRRTVRQIVERFQPEAVIWFGSYVYGEPNEHSDIDILVVMPAKNEMSQENRIRNAVEHPFPLDLFVRTPENLKWRLEEGDWFLREIVSRGKLLYSQKSTKAWIQAWRASFHWPEPGHQPANHLSGNAPMKKTTAEWVQKAEADYRIARLGAKAKPPLYDPVCFHCQQCAEKYLKALLQEGGLAVPRTHELEDLLNLLLPQHGSLRGLRRGLKSLTPYAVEIRYPQQRANSRKARAALRNAERVRQEIRTLLGLPPQRRKSP